MRYKGLDLNLLLALDVLLEVRHVSRAADRLGLSQSALSAALARLRDYFQDDLLTVEGRRMQPTPYAEEIAAHVRACLAATDTLLTTSRSFIPETATRTFRIVASDYVIAAILVHLARNLATTAPGIRLEFILPDESATHRIDRGELDLLIGPPEFLMPNHPSEELYAENHVIAGWQENPLFRGRITEEAIFAAGHVAVSVGSHRTTTFGDQQLSLINRERRIDAVVSSFTMVPWMLAGTHRLAVMHERLAAMMSRHLPITYRQLPFPFPTMLEMAQYHRTRASDVGLHWLIGEVRAQALSGET